MKSKVLKRYRVYENIITCLDKHLPAWQHVKEMSKTHDRFVRNFKKLSDHKAVLEQDLKSMTDRHARIHKDLVDRIRPLLGVLSVYASDNRSKALGKQLDISSKQLGELKDPRLLKLSEVVISLDSDEKKGKSGTLNASDYGLTGEMIDDIRAKSEGLRSSRAALKAAIKERKRSTEAARSLIKEMTNCLSPGPINLSRSSG